MQTLAYYFKNKTYLSNHLWIEETSNKLLTRKEKNKQMKSNEIFKIIGEIKWRKKKYQVLRQYTLLSIKGFLFSNT